MGILTGKYYLITSLHRKPWRLGLQCLQRGNCLDVFRASIGLAADAPSGSGRCCATKRFKNSQRYPVGGSNPMARAMKDCGALTIVLGVANNFAANSAKMSSQNMRRMTPMRSSGKIWPEEKCAFRPTLPSQMPHSSATRNAICRWACIQ